MYKLINTNLGPFQGGDIVFGNNYFYISDLIYPGNRFWGFSYGTLFEHKKTQQRLLRPKAGEFKYIVLGGREEPRREG